MPARTDRVQRLLQTELGRIVDRELSNPNLPEFITIHGVRVSRDLSEADVYFTLLDDESRETVQRTVEELNKAAGYIRTLIARRVVLRRHPHLRFHYTDATHQAAELEQVFRELRQEREDEQDDG